MAILLNYSIICHDGTKSATDGSLLELSTTKIYKIVKFVRDHPERTQPWQIGGNLSSCIGIDTILKYLHFGDKNNFMLGKNQNFSIDLTTVE